MVDDPAQSKSSPNLNLVQDVLNNNVAQELSVPRSPKLLLLDEATSALDTATERNIQAALQEVYNFGYYTLSPSRAKVL